MKSLLKNTLFTCVLTVTALGFLSSCFPDPAEPNSRLQIAIEINDTDSTLTSGSDSLTISGVRMVHGKSFFTISQDSIIPLTGYIHQLSFSTESNDSLELIYPGPNSRFASGPIPEGVYQELTLKIIRAPQEPGDNVGSIDNIFTDGGSYSIIVNGLFNGEEFSFKASKDFNYPYNFTPDISVTTTAKTYIFLISSSVKNWFEKTGGNGFLNPKLDENKPVINANIEQFFTIEQLSPN